MGLYGPPRGLLDRKRHGEKEKKMEDENLSKMKGKNGSIIEYIPMEKSEIDDILSQSTSTQRSILFWASKGEKSPAIAKRLELKPSTMRKYLRGSFRQAYLTLVNNPVGILSVDSIVKMAEQDAPLYYSVIQSIATGKTETASDRSVALSASKEGLQLGGAYRNLTTSNLSIGQLLVQIAQNGLLDTVPEPTKEGIIPLKEGDP